jgi:transcriptional regulator with XRE-family HTH domain
MNLAELRNARGMTQRKLALLAGVHPGTISKIERAIPEGRPSWELCKRLAVLYGVTSLDLADALDVPLTASQRREATCD